ncbi:hypothetical protein VNO77_05299 [Canavalia gladiata]|uniref:Uncharacterized protein n=1 Tax=Canavalia gladiata TaxID=3824 RepID=A0AAN9RE09_CANGL
MGFKKPSQISSHAAHHPSPLKTTMKLSQASPQDSATWRFRVPFNRCRSKSMDLTAPLQQHIIEPSEVSTPLRCTQRLERVRARVRLVNAQGAHSAKRQIKIEMLVDPIWVLKSKAIDTWLQWNG